MNDLQQGIIFRKLVAADFSAVQEIALTMQSAQFNWDEKKISEELAHSLSYGAFYQGQLLAYLAMKQRSSEQFEISMLATAATHQGKGIMFALVNWLIAAIEQSFFKECPQRFEVWLEAHESNTKACNLYKKLGFQQVGFRANYYVDGGAAIVFSKFVHKSESLN